MPFDALFFENFICLGKKVLSLAQGEKIQVFNKKQLIKYKKLKVNNKQYYRPTEITTAIMTRNIVRMVTSVPSFFTTSSKSDKNELTFFFDIIFEKKF